MLYRIKAALRERKGLIITLCIFVLALGLFLRAFGSVEEQHLSEQQEALRQAVLRAAVACYSVEGVYPADVAYLQRSARLLPIPSFCNTTLSRKISCRRSAC